MATSLVKRVSSDQSFFLRMSSNFLRSFTTASISPPSENPSASSSASKKPKRKKKKNLFEVAQFLPNWGIGYHMSKKHWTDISYKITKINLYKDGRHGKAWGIAHRDGLPIVDAPKKISGVHKRCWRYNMNLSKLTGREASMNKSTENVPTAEVQAA